MENTLEKEFQYYIGHQDEFVEKYNGKYIVIKDCQLIGVFDSQLEAINETQKTHKLGTFLVHQCGSGEKNYTQTFHSRVRFA